MHKLATTQDPNRKPGLSPLRLEYHLTIAFNLLNRFPNPHTTAKIVEEYRENGKPLIMENYNTEKEIFSPPNMSFK